MSEPTKGERKFKLPSAQVTFRFFVYVGFAVCTLATIAILGYGGEWWAPMFGTFAFGVPAVAFYLREEENRQDRTTQAKTQEALGNSGGWNFDDGDPTEPPRHERTR